MVQMVAWMTSLFFMLMIAGVFGWVTIKSREKKAYQPIVKKWYKARKVYGIALVLFMVIVMIYTLRDLPFNQPVYSKGSEPKIVDVEAVKFGCNISETEFYVGKIVEFHFYDGVMIQYICMFVLVWILL